MRKFFAVVKREYIQRVRTKFFVIATILGPLMMVLLTVVPALMFSIKAGGPTRLAIVDQTGKMYGRVNRELAGNDNGDSEDAEQTPTPVTGVNANRKDQVDQAGKLVLGSYQVEDAPLKGRSIDDVKKDLDVRVRNKELEGYLILPADLLKDGQPAFYGRNTADVFTGGHIQTSISRAVRAQRMVEAHIDEVLIRKMSQPVRLKTKSVGGNGEESNAGQSFYLVFAMGLLIYMTILLYGQLVLGAIIEEKETRIAEILFSSIRSFPLMMGKLIGVALVALTQLSIWGLAVAIFTSMGVPVLASR